MKKISISAFGIFVFCLFIRTYSYVSYSDLNNKQDSQQSLTSNDKRKTIALLNTLNDLTKKTPSKTNYRELSSDDLQLRRKKESLIISFIEGFYAPIENLEQLKNIQKEISIINDELNIDNLPLEYLDIETLYYFVIRENFSLRDFQGVIVFEDLGFPFLEVRKIEEYSRSEDFRRVIFDFKNIQTFTNKADEVVVKIDDLKLEENEDELSLSIESFPVDDKDSFLKAADEQEYDLEKKLQEMDYTEAEVEEMLNGFEI